MQFFHINSPTEGRATVAMNIFDGQFAISVAKCAPKDQFNKKIGREVAAGRLQALIDGKARQHKHIYTFQAPSVVQDVRKWEAAARQFIAEVGGVENL